MQLEKNGVREKPEYFPSVKAKEYMDNFVKSTDMFKILP